MECKEIRTWLHGYLDRELDLARTVEIERHIQDCAACSQILESHKTLQTSIRGAGLEFRCPDALRSRIQSAVQREVRSLNPRPIIPLRRLAVAAAFLLTAGVSWFVAHPFSGPSDDDLLAQEVVAGHVRSLLADHLTDVASSDRHTVKPWFSGKVDFAPTVVDFSAEGFPLVGGRLDYLDHRPVAALVYRRRKHMINLFLWPSEKSATGKSATGALQSSSHHGYQMIHWTKAGTAYWAISDLNSSELRQFIELIRDARPDRAGNIE